MRLGDKVAVTTPCAATRGGSPTSRADDAAKVQLGGRFRDARACTSRGPLNVAVLTTD
ncbi:MAG: hypothetical protein R2697_19705 [Ilumatobacteraceae bacterium]